MKRRVLMSALPLWLATPLARSQDAVPPVATAGRKYVVMSLVGDKLTYVVKSGFAGTTGGRNQETEVPMPGSPHDIAALKILAAAVPARDPGATTSLLAVSAPEFYAGQDDWFDGDAVKLPEKLRHAVAGEQGSRLLLLTKWRGDAQISDGHTAVGYGKLAGLGMYSYAMRERSDASMAGDVKSYMAPFVYVRMSLVDASTFRVVREQIIRSGTPYPVMTPQAQLDALQAMLETSLKDALAQVVPAA